MIDLDARATTRRLLLAGVAAPACLFGVSLAVGLLSPGYDPVRRSISALANSPTGWLMTVAFVVTGVLEVAFAVGASRVIGVSRRQRTFVGGVIVMLAVLTVLFALFPTDPPGAPRTTVGRIHLLVALGYALLLPACAVLFVVVFRRDVRWQAVARPTLLVALVQVLLFPVLVVAVNGELRPWLGLVERVYFTIPAVWQATIAIRATRLEDAPLG
jgi:hypothetical membrane protein